MSSVYKADLVGFFCWGAGVGLLCEKERDAFCLTLGCQSRILLYFISVSARARHCGNPVLQSEMAPRKTKKGPIWPFPFTRLQA